MCQLESPVAVIGLTIHPILSIIIADSITVLSIERSVLTSPNSLIVCDGIVLYFITGLEFSALTVTYKQSHIMSVICGLKGEINEFKRN